MSDKKVIVKPAEGKLGVLIPGLGAVATTFIAGVEAAKRQLGAPIGSLTQMGRIRLGKRTENRNPLIHEFVPLANLSDIVWGAWDLHGQNAYEVACRSRVLEQGLLDKVRKPLEEIVPLKAVFDPIFVKNLQGVHVKSGPSKKDLADQVMADIDAFVARTGVSRVVMLWCGSTETFTPISDVHRSLAAFEAGLAASHPEIAPSMIYAYAALKKGIPYLNGAPNLTVDMPALLELSRATYAPIGGKDFKTGQTLMKTIIAPGLKARMLGVEGWFSTNILGNLDGKVLDDPGSFKTKEESKLSVLDTIFNGELYPHCTAGSTTRCASTTTRPAVTTRRVGTTSTSWAGWATRCRSRSTSCAATRSWPLPSAWIWCCSPTWRSAAAGPASRSGSPSTGRARRRRRDCPRSTTCSSSRTSSRTRCATSWERR